MPASANTNLRRGKRSVMPLKTRCGMICAGVVAEVAVMAEWPCRGE